MQYYYTTTREIIGTQALICSTLHQMPERTSTINQLEAKLVNSGTPIKRPLILRNIQELELKKVVFCIGKIGKSNIYKLNSESLKKD